MDFVNLVSQLDTLELPSKRQNNNCKRKRKSNQSVRFDVPDDVTEKKKTSKRRRYSPLPFSRTSFFTTSAEFDAQTVHITKETHEVEDEIGHLTETGLQALKVTVYETDVEGVNTDVKYADTGIPCEPLDRNNNYGPSAKYTRKKQGTRKCMSDTALLNAKRLVKKGQMVSKKISLRKPRHLTKRRGKPRERRYSLHAQGDGHHGNIHKTKRPIIRRKCIHVSCRRTKSSKILIPKNKTEKRKRIVKLTYQAKRSLIKNKAYTLVNKTVAEKKMIFNMSMEQLWKEYKTAKCSRFGDSFFSTTTHSESAKRTLKNMWKDYQKLRQKKRKCKITPIKRRGDPFELSEVLRIDLLKYLTFKKADEDKQRCCSKHCWKSWVEVDGTYIREEYGDVDD
ncbi:uncharacterized protein LOC127866680 isoform X2 [Dreissena polymorpha]|uniref:uncharacterized protein LOC127866680 isoform X2 n=1 Tax=Dreissena polymorpha TaxID=45954 RepID=UPI002263C48D|nr:uncharacterized protein LOC127866680 isoform X2 [Dreissena polymorpha]